MADPHHPHHPSMDSKAQLSLLLDTFLYLNRRGATAMTIGLLLKAHVDIRQVIDYHIVDKGIVISIKRTLPPKVEPYK